MNAKKGEAGFTLIELIISLAIFGIVLISIYNINLAVWRFCSYNQQKIDLKQQARVITIYLERDIKKAIAVKIEDLDGDGDNELLLNLGDNAGTNDETDKNTDYYLLYDVTDHKLIVKKPKVVFNKSGVKYPAWPNNDDWGNNRSITMEIVDEHEFAYDEGLVSYQFKLVQGVKSYLLLNKVFPRILK